MGWITVQTLIVTTRWWHVLKEWDEGEERQSSLLLNCLSLIWPRLQWPTSSQSWQTHFLVVSSLPHLCCVPSSGLLCPVAQNSISSSLLHLCRCQGDAMNKNKPHPVQSKPLVWVSAREHVPGSGSLHYALTSNSYGLHSSPPPPPHVP